MKYIRVVGYLLMLCSCQAGTAKARKMPVVPLPDARAVVPLIADTSGQSLIALAERMTTAPEESASDAEDEFVRALLQALRQPGAFESKFSLLEQQGIQVLAADDNRFRIISWLSPYSGTMWQVYTIIQYRDGQNVVAIPFNSLYEQQEDEGGPTPFFEHVYALDTAPATYLLTGYGQMSGPEPYAVCHTLVWEQGTFHMDKQLFKEGRVMRSGLFAQANLRDDQQPEKTRELLRITYDPRTRILSYPEARNTEEGYMFTGRIRSLVYRNGIFR